VLTFNKAIGIVGTRRKDGSVSYTKVEKLFLELAEQGDVIISGGCKKGGDRFAEVIARKFAYPVVVFYANWKKYSKGGGMVRNTDIAKNSDILIACVAADRKGGTEDTIKKFLDCNSEKNLYIVE
jgi:hypothetical protein